MLYRRDKATTRQHDKQLSKHVRQIYRILYLETYTSLGTTPWFLGTTNHHLSFDLSCKSYTLVGATAEIQACNCYCQTAASGCN